MADYSNLFRGGGISSPGRKRSGKGGRMMLVFVIVCVIAAAAVWKLYSVASKDSGAEKNPSVSSRETVNNSGDKPSALPEIKSVTLDSGTRETAPDRLPSLSPKKLAEVKNTLNQAEQALKADDYVKARDAATKIIDSGVAKDSSIWKKAVSILGEANVGIFMTDVPAPEKQLYTIKEGDNLISIANRFSTTVEAIQKSNGLNPASPIIYPGKTLYIYTGKWTVKVSKRERRLYLYSGDRLFKVYTVGIGRQGRSPTGTFKISTKLKDPEWTYNGRTIPFGDKENVLGTRWMALTPTGKTNPNLRGYGIHGTWQPESVGTECSNGCIRMKNEDVNELFSILPYRTEVIIED